MILYEVFKDNRRVGIFLRAKAIKAIGTTEKEFNRAIREDGQINNYTIYIIENKHDNDRQRQAYTEGLLLEWDKTVKELLPMLEKRRLKLAGEKRKAWN